MNKFRIKVSYDDGDFNDPREWEEFGKMICFHNRYNLGDKHSLNKDDFSRWSELEDFLRKERNAEIILPLYLYDHSGITMNTTGFSCGWDSGQVGFIYVSRQGILDEYGVKRITKDLREKVTQRLVDDVKLYDQYLTGDVYYFTIEKCIPMIRISKEDFDAGVMDNAEEECEWEFHDSCHGFYGTNIDNGIVDNSGVREEIVRQALDNLEEWIEYEE